ncbi:septum formation family protein [Nocardioides sambongensis]|uniref:septum formation family protein n=1 Tax=Nocardioides sambongensis TaxID=2589074 RepID=UPI00112703F2|nr:septum formation family protein [Nocardioides sambongensis]
MGLPRRAVMGVVAALTVALTGCSQQPQGSDVDPDQVDAVSAPENGVCRNLDPADVEMPANATEVVDCGQPHTAETFAVDELPAEFDDSEYTSKDLSSFAYRACTDAFMEHMKADESTVLRTILTWAWFRPSEKAWDEGARWYRCDVVGGRIEHQGESDEYRPLPETTAGLLAGRPEDRWMTCAAGPSVAEGTKVACNQRHDWRAVTTIKLGEPDDPYPGDEVAESRTRSYCQKSVEAWLNYPSVFDFGYTYFHEAEWDAGNRRSVCWAQTDE